MFNLRPVLYIFALSLIACGIFEALPGVIEWAYGGPNEGTFFAAAAIAVFIGGALALTTHQKEVILNLRQAFLLTPLCWFGLPIFACLPFIFAGHPLSFTDAYFETVSGFTTTGATVYSGLDNFDPGILLWRSILQWLGGIGFIMMGVAILPFLKVGGMQIMRTEYSDKSDKFMPRATEIAGAIVKLYLVLTLLCVLAYWASGMTLFDSLNHAMTTLSTGGYSTTDSSIGGFPALSQWTAVVFMILGSLPFVVMLRRLHGHGGSLFDDSQIRWFLVTVAVLIVGVAIWLLVTAVHEDPEAALRTSAVSIISIVTTTGYASGDYQLWGSELLPLFLFLMLIGGCTGSTTGGVKFFRWQILFEEAGRQLAARVNPHRVFPQRYNGAPLPEEVPRSVAMFLSLFLALILLFTALLTWTGLDFVTAISGATTALTNVGPGLGPIIGPAGNFSSLPDSAKWICSIAMVMGRLELLTVLVLFDWHFWVR